VEVGESIVLIFYVDVPVRWVTTPNLDPARCAMQVASVISQLDMTLLGFFSEKSRRSILRSMPNVEPLERGNRQLEWHCFVGNGFKQDTGLRQGIHLCRYGQVIVCGCGVCDW
jgi:hypothetical protein